MTIQLEYLYTGLFVSAIAIALSLLRIPSGRTRELSKAADHQLYPIEPVSDYQPEN